MPWAITGLGFVALAFVLLPLVGLGLRVPWGDLGSIISAPATRDMLRITLTSSLLATLITVLLGLPLALWMQGRQTASRIAQAFMFLPLIMPPVVAGLALSASIGNRGILSPVLSALGIQFAFAFPGVVVAHTFVALPFVVLTLSSSLRQLDPEIVASAHSVGLSPWKTIRLVVLPTLAPALYTAAGLAFARSLGEFGTTLTFAGSMPGVTRTMPLGIYLAREIDQSEAYGLAAILIGVAVLVIALASLPALLLYGSPAEEVRTIGPIDAATLARLTQPTASPRDVVVGPHVFPASSTTALIGPNGAGKTTLAQRIAGRLNATNSQEISNTARGVVLLTQNSGLPPRATALGAVAMVAGRERAEVLLRAAGLEELCNVRVTSLSGGQAAQVALVRALASRPAVLVLDEPLAAVDAYSAMQWRRVLRATAGTRTTIMITHNYLDITGVCEYTAVMEAGDVVSVRETADELVRPTTAFAAQLAGLNWIRGAQGAQHPNEASGYATFTPQSEEFTVKGIAAHPSFAGAAAAVFSAEDLIVVTNGAQSRAPDTNVLTWSVRAADPMPSGYVDVELANSSDATVTLLLRRKDVDQLAIAPGTQLRLTLAADKLRIYPLP